MESEIHNICSQQGSPDLYEEVLEFLTRTAHEKRYALLYRRGLLLREEAVNGLLARLQTYLEKRDVDISPEKISEEQSEALCLEIEDFLFS